MSETVLDLRGLKCPLPALRLKKALSGLNPGAIIIAECSDPLAAVDIPNLVRQTGDILEDQSQASGAIIFRIRKR